MYISLATNKRSQISARLTLTVSNPSDPESFVQEEGKSQNATCIKPTEPQPSVPAQASDSAKAHAQDESVVSHFYLPASAR